MLDLKTRSRAIRAAMVIVATFASIATSAPNSFLDAPLTVTRETGAGSPPVTVSVVLDVAGHPAITRNPSPDLFVAIHSEPNDARGTVVVTGPDGSQVTSDLADAGGVRAALATWLDWRSRSGAPICPTDAGCSVPFSVEVRDVDVPAATLTIELDARLSFNRYGPPPGEITLREVVP